MKTFAFTFSLIVCAGLYAQEQDGVRTLTLEECIQIAQTKNLDIKRSENNLLAARSNKRQAMFNFLPTATFNYDYTYIDGATITNAGTVVPNTSEQSSPDLTSNFTVFNAFANHHTLNRRKHEYESSRLQLEDQKISVEATVIRNYLNVLVDSENVRISDQRLELLENQFEREKKRESVGVGNLETVYNFQSQVATERLNNVNLKNQYQSDLLTLLQLLQLNDGTDVRITPLDLNNEILLDYDDYPLVLDQILKNSFNLRSADESQIAAKAQFQQAKSARYPFVGVFAQHSRNYTSASEIEYSNQIQNNTRDILSASISIPILNGYQNQNSIDNAKVSMLNAQLQHDQAMLNVTNAAQSDYLDLVAAQTSYKTANENYEALNQTFEFIKKRFEAGNTDFYSYLESLNNKNRAEAQLINAKYTILLRKRILDLYRG